MMRFLAENFKELFIEKVHQLSGTFTKTEDFKNVLLLDFPLESFEAFHRVSKTDILKTLNKINSCNYPGDPFDVKTIIFCLIKDSLAFCLSKIVESSFEAGMFPESEKQAIIRPKIKQGKPADELASYRSLYNTSMVSEVLESATL